MRPGQELDAPERFLRPYRAAVRRCPHDAQAHFQLGLMLYHLGRLRMVQRGRANASGPWWRRAARALERALSLDPSLAKAMAVLGLIRAERGTPDAARPLLERAVRLQPKDAAYAGQLFAVLAELGRAKDLARWMGRVAAAQGVNLVAIRRTLRASGFPTNAYTVLVNAFPGYRGLDSAVTDEVEAVRRRQEGRSSEAHELAQAHHAREAIRIDRRRMPAPLRTVIPMARRWGVGDDGHREALERVATTTERRALRQAVTPRVCRTIAAWLGSFGDGARLSREAAHFLYLLEAREEMRGRRRSRRLERLS